MGGLLVRSARRRLRSCCFAALIDLQTYWCGDPARVFSTSRMVDLACVQSVVCWSWSWCGSPMAVEEKPHHLTCAGPATFWTAHDGRVDGSQRETGSVIQWRKLTSVIPSNRHPDGSTAVVHQPHACLHTAPSRDTLVRFAFRNTPVLNDAT